MSQNDLKLSVAKAALDYVVQGKILGVGTGSTVNFFIDELAKMKDKIPGAVASSKATEQRLKSHGIKVYELNEIDQIDVYIDGADEINSKGNMIKGGGGALTREKIIAAVAGKFVCIVDKSKFVETLGKFPLPVEVIPMATSMLIRIFKAMGAQAQLRLRNNEPFITDNGNYILDVLGLHIREPKALEHEINQLVGVVTVGLFANRSADICLLGTPAGVKTLAF